MKLFSPPSLLKAPRARWFIGAVLGLVLWIVLRSWGRVEVNVELPKRGPAVHAVYATGTVEPSVMIPIAARWMARLQKLHVDEGAVVTKNQLLAELENDDRQSMLVAARSKESFARAEFERNRALFAKGAVAIQTFERAKSEWEVAKAAAEQAQAESGFLSLLAPADGVLIRRDGEIGQMIPANQPVFWLSASAPLRITAEVDEEDIVLVKESQAVVIRADAFPGKVFHGRVQQITPKGDPIARSYRVRIELTESTPLQIGMTAETNIVVSERSDAMLIPTSALENGQVWCVVNGVVEARPVTVGVHGLHQVEIVEGLSMDDQVVVVPPATMRAGMRVRPIQVSQER